MRSGDILCGNRETFGIECHIEFVTSTSAKNPAGQLWFWIGGAAVGNRGITSLPGIVANDLRQTLLWCGLRVDPELFAADGGRVLNAIEQGLYESPRTAEADGQEWVRFLICMSPGGHEYIDGWLTVMVEGPERVAPSKERIVFRSPDMGSEQYQEVWLTSGTYKATVEEFLRWFDGDPGTVSGT